MKHGTPLSIAYENGQYREYLILVEELMKTHFAKYFYHVNMPFFSFLFFANLIFTKTKILYMISNKKMNDMLKIFS